MVKNITVRPWFGRLVFFVLLIFMAFFYNYQNYLFYRPQSVHAWRQADCASLTLNYYQNGMQFFRPEVHNLTSDGGTTGYCSTSEVPVLYYFVAGLYKMFGPHEFFIRLVNMLIFFTGLFFLYKTIVHLYNDKFWGIALSLLFFTSPVLVYYGNNFLTNVSALSLSIAGLYFFVRYYSERLMRYLILSLFFLMLAGFFKITALMPLFALIGSFLLEKLGLIKNTYVFKHSKVFLFGSVSVLILVGAWIVYAAYYNKCHDCYYFSTTIFPLWEMSMEKIKELAVHVAQYWFTEYFHPLVHLFFAFLLVLIFALRRKADRFFMVVLLLLILQSVAYIVLQFWTFYDHDYYTIEQNIVPVVIILTAFGAIRATKPQISKSLVVKIVFAFFLLFNVRHAKQQVSERYTGWKNQYYKEKKDIYSISPYLVEQGLKSDDKVIFVPDGSNVSLYLMNQKGWTQYTDARFNRGNAIIYNRDSAGIAKSIEQGAQYLIVNNIADIYLNPYLKSFCSNLKGKYGEVLVFSLSGNTANFILNEPVATDTLICNAEVTEEGFFAVASGGLVFGNGNTQSDEEALTGSYSSRLTRESPYGMTYIEPKTVYGKSYMVTVWRKGGSEAGIIASGPAESNFYYKNIKSHKTDTLGGWEKLQLHFFVPRSLDGKELKIYLFNPSEAPVYFDNLEIIRYESIANR
ncbi:MAG: glycosyltransferase family 39 protein [Bacteroidales bacterium]|nr:glycosyltransferase family 39 protein [Bacteroidales bacterium]